MDTNKVAFGIKVFGAIFAVICVSLLVWSLFRPPVTTGPTPDVPSYTVALDAGRG